MHESLGGGVAGVHEASAHSDRVSRILWIITDLLKTIVLQIIGLRVVNCCCYCCEQKDVTCAYVYENP